ncbi:NACHT domain-containing NTPase [Siphonobacter sp. SORGH_AS_1065]|uniref:NACHT domain-containing protein n=1 Tax=Siphonobacter sp. SORGH_AS_1065 TaxID=3041795 RepID=UPI00278AA2F5|nr:hypothetical protein [Siphonobacter sp. SORGH_AS_1065]MDQ1089434.1 hypothetical protein [Siphonobacter sp. SORGH_AS_1065]
MLTTGGFVILLDGYDEIPLDSRGETTDQIQNFTSRYSNNLFLISSRNEPALATFSGFEHFFIRPLKKNEAFSLLRKYNQNGELSGQLIKKVEEVYGSIKEFLVNPLLVSLLYTSYEFKNTIPLKKHVFYRQVYDALYENHDLTKEGAFQRTKHCHNLDIEDFHKILRYIGFISLKNNTIEFTRDEIIPLLTKAKEYHKDLKFRESDFLNDLTSAVPLFIIDGFYFKWAHKSLQEYFAAQFVFTDAGENKEVILTKMCQRDDVYKILNMLDLYRSIDSLGFRNIFLLRYAENLYNSIYSNDNVGNNNDVINRKIILFFYKIRFYLVPKKDVIEFTKSKDFRDEVYRKVASFRTPNEMSPRSWIVPELSTKRIAMLVSHNSAYSILNLFTNDIEEMLGITRVSSHVYKTIEEYNWIIKSICLSQGEGASIHIKSPFVKNEQVENVGNLNAILEEGIGFKFYFDINKLFQFIEDIKSQSQNSDDFLLKGL